LPAATFPLSFFYGFRTVQPRKWPVAALPRDKNEKENFMNRASLWKLAIPCLLASAVFPSLSRAQVPVFEIMRRKLD